MIIHNIIVGAKEDIPEKYLESIFQLMQKDDRKNHPFDPPHIDYYKKSWGIPDLSWEKAVRVVGTNENDEVEVYARMGWNIKYDNLEQAWYYIHLQENEDKNNNRIIILKELIKHLPEQLKKVSTWFLKDSEAVSFYRQIKEDHAFEEILFISKLEEQNLDLVSLEARKHKEKALQKGYDIIFVEGLKYEGSVNYSQFVNLIECVWNDMPRDQLSEENLKLTVERYNELCAHNQKRWETFLSFIAIDKKTKEPVGITTTVTDDYQPDIVYQWETGVLHEHRGNGLGLALKYLMLEKLLDSTKTKIWYTGSSSVNVHMHKINEILGYKKWNSELVFEFTKEEILNFLEKI